MTDTKRLRELLARYEGTGVTYAKAAHADAICALLPALLDENESLKAEVGRLRWIPVSERLPDYCDDVGSGRVLALFAGGETSVAYRDQYYATGGSGFTDGFDWVEPCSGELLNLHYDLPTHWMPLPAAPEGN